MDTIPHRFPVLLRAVAVATLLAAAAVPGAHAVVVTYSAVLNGANESPPNASPGGGFAEVVVDDVAHTMQVTAAFEGLTGTTTAAHIHGPTATAGTGTAGVATTVPTFAGFPLGVQGGVYNATLDLAATSTYSASFVAANGGTAAGAEAALLQALAEGKTYFNIHTSMYTGGEIRGFLTASLVPAEQSTWGQAKTLYR